MKKSILATTLLVAFSCFSCAKRPAEYPNEIDESDVYEVIHRDAYFYWAANRGPASTYYLNDEMFKHFYLPFRFGVYNGYYACYMKMGDNWCYYGWNTIDYSKPIDYGDGLVLNLLECTSIPNYIVWKDHRVHLLVDAFELGLLSRDDMQGIANSIDEMYESAKEVVHK